jgi:hypothetical protein
MNAFVLSAFLQLGMLSGGAVMYEPPQQILVNDLPCYATLGVRADYGMFFAEGAIQTDMKPVSIGDWFPTQETYSIGCGISYKFVTLGFRHVCYHPMTPYMVYSYDIITPSFEGATNDLYLRLEIGGKR